MNANNKSNMTHSQASRLTKITRACSLRFWSQLDSTLKTSPRLPYKSLYVQVIMNLMPGTKRPPTLNEICEIGRKSNLLLLFKLETMDEIVDVLFDPEALTVSQINGTLRDWMGVLNPVGDNAACDALFNLDGGRDEGDGWGDDEEDENPIPGHEEDDDEQDEETGDEEADPADGNDSDDSEGEDEQEDEDEDEDVDEEDDSDDDWDDDDENERNQDDDKWKLRRLIAAVDRADLRLRFALVKKIADEEVLPVRVWSTMISPRRTHREFAKEFSWWPTREAWLRNQEARCNSSVTLSCDAISCDADSCDAAVCDAAVCDADGSGAAVCGAFDPKKQ